MPANKIDFKYVREHADFPAVLARYGIDLTKDGHKPGQFKARCPFHDDQKPSLKINTDRRLYNCFPCGASGNVLDFVVAMDGVELRDAARLIAEVSNCALSPEGPLPRRRAKPAKAPAAKKADVPAEPPPEDDTPVENAPLSFELKLTQPPELLAWLETRGLTADTVETFGLGLASKKARSIADRLAIPLHNTAGELIGYCGRYAADAVPDDIPKYVLPSGFHKDRELYNLNRVSADTAKGYVVLVESYFSVMRHHPALPIVSPFGRTISAAQISLLRERGFTRAVIVGDGDEPGRSGARDIAAALAPHLWTRVVDLEDGAKPHHLDTDTFRALLRSALT